MKFRYQKFPLPGHDPQRPLIARPFIPVYLHRLQLSTPNPFYALLDSGSDTILLPSGIAEKIGIDDITEGEVEPTIGIADQRIEIYYFNLHLQVYGDERRLPTKVGFSDLSLSQS